MRNGVLINATACISLSAYAYYASALPVHPIKPFSHLYDDFVMHCCPGIVVLRSISFEKVHEYSFDRSLKLSVEVDCTING